MHNPQLYDQPDWQSDYMDPSENSTTESQHEVPSDESSTDYVVVLPYEKLKRQGNRRILALFIFALIVIVSWAIFSLKTATVTITALLIAIFVAASVAGFLIIFKK